MVKRDNPGISEVLLLYGCIRQKWEITVREVYWNGSLHDKKLVKTRKQSISESPEDKLTEVNLKEYTRGGRVFVRTERSYHSCWQEKANNDPDKAVRCTQHRRTTILVPRGIKTLLVSGGDIFRGSQQAK